MHCRDVLVLDVRHLSPVTDYFVLATGTSATQLRATAYSAAEVGADRNYKPLSLAGYEGESWIVVDFVHVVLHVFSEDSRQYYDLDTLWGDAPRVEWEAKPAPPVTSDTPAKPVKRAKATKTDKPARAAKGDKPAKARKSAKTAASAGQAARPRATRTKKSQTRAASSQSNTSDPQAPENASQ